MTLDVKISIKTHKQTNKQIQKPWFNSRQSAFTLVGSTYNVDLIFERTFTMLGIKCLFTCVQYFVLDEYIMCYFSLTSSVLLDNVIKQILTRFSTGYSPYVNTIYTVKFFIFTLLLY